MSSGLAKQLTASDIAEQLTKLSLHLGQLVDELDTAERDAVNAREDYTLALSKAFLSADGPMDIRKHESIRQTHEQRLSAELAETRVRGLRRQTDTVKVRIDVGRSVGVALRAEMGLAGLTGAP